ncbi:hypothetical protein [Tengunoibacter tsumagoiensis]|uniref:Uncharacterized protein n=1 Tax=Tengunoibacter tsumagoiensis TaxID=2014871 RepID=A0A401ZW33_9CHLR|nr:hypothetical protein [Tengunoibacter tsumagoiensis]GCE11098.1 hypothetical protein KTT_09570 [Tengunoibacter tsumagoiensis]
MNATLCRTRNTTDLALEAYSATQAEDQFATAPMAVVAPLFQTSNEEELHTSFEEAISERTLALHGRLSRLSDPEVLAIERQHRTEPLIQTIDVHASLPSHRPRTFLTGKAQQTLMYGCLAMSCTFFGFDLMGLLILHMH